MYTNPFNTMCFAFSYKNYDIFVCSIPRALEITCVFLCEVFIPFDVCAQRFKKMLPSSAKTPHYANMQRLKYFRLK